MSVLVGRCDAVKLPNSRRFRFLASAIWIFGSAHCSRLPGSVIREWTLARCGHHPFMDGRAARHRGLRYPCLCCAADWSFIHAVRSCPMFLHWRNVWSRHLQSLGHAVDHFSDDALLRFLFSPNGRGNIRASIAARMSFVASICQAQRSLLEGLEPRSSYLTRLVSPCIVM